MCQEGEPARSWWEPTLRPQADEGWGGYGLAPQGLLNLPRSPRFLPGKPVCTPHTQSSPRTHGGTKSSRESWKPRPCPHCRGHGWEDRTAPTPQLGTGRRAWGWGGRQHLRLNHPPRAFRQLRAPAQACS